MNMLFKRSLILPISFLLSILCLIVSPYSFGAHEDKKYIIGYINHPRVNAFYKPLIQRAYEDIGITPVFEEVGGERGLRLLNEGMTDADVIRYEVVSQQDNNILIVQPALSQGVSYLLCMRKVRCDRSVIDNPDSAIAATTRFFDNMKATQKELTANIFEFDDFQHVISLLLNGRFNYAILPSDNSENEAFQRAGIEYIPLVEHPLVHVVHKKHAHLLDELSVAITKQLNEAELITSSP